MDLRIFSARQAAKQFGALLDAAEQGPVTIHRNGKPRAVLVSARDFACYEKAYRKDEKERTASLILRGLDLLKEGKLGKGERALALARRLRLNEERPGDAVSADKILDRRDG